MVTHGHHEQAVSFFDASRDRVVDWLPLLAGDGIVRGDFSEVLERLLVVPRVLVLPRRFNAYEPNDLDRDGAAISGDCDDFRSTVWAAPAEVDALRLEKLVGATRLSWVSQKITAASMP